jgi:hypothetical protein
VAVALEAVGETRAVEAAGTTEAAVILKVRGPQKHHTLGQLALAVNANKKCFYCTQFHLAHRPGGRGFRQNLTRKN